MALLLTHLVAYAVVPAKPGAVERDAEAVELAVAGYMCARGGKRKAMQVLEPGPRAASDDTCLAAIVENHPPLLQASPR